MASQRDLSGIVQPGRGLGAGLMADSDVMERLQELVGFPIVPGTLNLRLPRPLERGSSWRYVAAAEISPDWEARTGQAGYYLAPVTIAERFRGLAFQADEPGYPGYPSDQIELFQRGSPSRCTRSGRRRPDHRLGGTRAQMAAAGLTNREIGQKLYIPPHRRAERVARP